MTRFVPADPTVWQVIIVDPEGRQGHGCLDAQLVALSKDGAAVECSNMAAALTSRMEERP